MLPVYLAGFSFAERAEKGLLVALEKQQATLVRHAEFIEDLKNRPENAKGSPTGANT